MNRELAGILTYLPVAIRRLLGELPAGSLSGLEEIRLRLGRPVVLRFSQHDSYLANRGGLTQKAEDAWRIAGGEMQQMVLLLTNSSFYALDNELRQGYITLPGGHRAGICGKAVLEQGRIKSLKDISSVNIRLARQIQGAGERLLPYLWGKDQPLPWQTLIISPPRAGKTTLLRDLARLFAEGSNSRLPLQVAVVDERSELAAVLEGRPQMWLGSCCDVLDGAPKGEGIMLLLRSMAPQLIICDEIGGEEDAEAIAEAVNAGVRLIASAHGASGEEISKRPTLAKLLQQKAFQRLVILSHRLGPGTVEAVLDENLQRLRVEC
ncbi:MAG: stage III sporulation protein AA [Clostridiales bacterium]|nr:stage III sporulation protein AA [Clostridiales bacterium]